MALKAWNAVDSNQFISAQYLWTGIDYLGEAGRWPQRSNGAGLMDLAGFQKPEYYFRQSIWSKKPMIYIGATKVSNEEDKSIWRHLRAEPTWNWNTGDKLRINCFTNCSEAELFLNEKSLGRKSMTEFPNHIIYWDVNYEAGEIKVKGYNNGETITTNALKTTGEATSINAYAEKDTTGKTNLVQVIININDRQGNRVYNAENEITLTLPRGATLLGLESGSNTSHEDYKLNKRKAFHGRLIAYVQLSKTTKHAEAVISSPGLGSHTLKLD
jgi:hypothetical protein